jgi:peroxiredoxin Q/BCP
MDKATLNEPAPDFTLKDGNGEDWRLSDHRGKVVVLLFYPGDETPICTRQMCSVRDRWELSRTRNSLRTTICLCVCCQILMALHRSFMARDR